MSRSSELCERGARNTNAWKNHVSGQLLSNQCPLPVGSPWRALKLANQPFDALNVAVTSIRRVSSCNAFPLMACPSVHESFSHAISFPSSCLQVTWRPAPSSRVTVFFTVHNLSPDVRHSLTCFSLTPKCSAAFLLLPNLFAFSITFNLKSAS